MLLAGPAERRRSGGGAAAQRRRSGGAAAAERLRAVPGPQHPGVGDFRPSAPEHRASAELTTTDTVEEALPFCPVVDQYPPIWIFGNPQQNPAGAGACRRVIGVAFGTYKSHLE